MATIDLLTSAFSATGYALDPATLVFSSVDASLTIVDNGDGTIDVTGDELGYKEFTFTVDDTNGTTSDAKTSGILVRPVDAGVLPGTVSGLIQHLRAEDIVETDGQTFTSWPAAVGNDGSLSSNANTVVADPSILGGEKAVLWKPGATVYVTVSDPWGATQTAMSFFVVCTPYERNGNAILGWLNAGWRVMNDNGSQNKLIWQGTTPSFTSGAYRQFDSMVLSGRWDGTTAKFYAGHWLISSESASGTMANGDFRVGSMDLGGFAFEGTIAEVGLYDEYLSDIDLHNVIRGLNMKYGINN